MFVGNQLKEPVYIAQNQRVVLILLYQEGALCVLNVFIEVEKLD